jgi:hypothetical protein
MPGLFGLDIRTFKSSAECLSGMISTARGGHAAEGMIYPTTWKLTIDDRLQTQCIIHTWPLQQSWPWGSFFSNLKTIKK